jgi:hypothetical protein
MPPQCDGCLGDLECWVCLGSGSVEAPDGSRRPCHSCDGSGYCSYCEARPDPRIQVLYLTDHKHRDSLADEDDEPLPGDAGLIAL